MNLANKLTILRIFMIPVFLIVLLQNTETMFMIAGVIFIVASLTDFLDGYIARSRNMITKFGKFMDPLADKLLTMAAFVAFVELQLIPAWVVILIIARELTISVFRAIAAADGLVLAAGKLGKYKTVSQMLCIILFCFNNYPFETWSLPMDQILLYLCAFLTVLSGYDYIIKNKSVLE